MKLDPGIHIDLHSVFFLKLGVTPTVARNAMATAALSRHARIHRGHRPPLLDPRAVVRRPSRAGCRAAARPRPRSAPSPDEFRDHPMPISN